MVYYWLARVYGEICQYHQQACTTNCTNELIFYYKAFSIPVLASHGNNIILYYPIIRMKRLLLHSQPFTFFFQQQPGQRLQKLLHAITIVVEAPYREKQSSGRHPLAGAL